MLVRKVQEHKTRVLWSQFLLSTSLFLEWSFMPLPGVVNRNGFTLDNPLSCYSYSKCLQLELIWPCITLRIQIDALNKDGNCMKLWCTSFLSPILPGPVEWCQECFRIASRPTLHICMCWEPLTMRKLKQTHGGNHARELVSGFESQAKDDFFFCFWNTDSCHYGGWVHHL